MPSKGVVGKKVHRAGRYKECKAIGWYVDAYKRAQLSINLTNYKVTSPVDVLEASRIMAAERGLVVTGSEIVGLVPFQALYQAGQRYLKAQGKSPSIPVADVLENAAFSMGLSDVAPFEIEKKVLGLPKAPGALMQMTGTAFVPTRSRAIRRRRAAARSRRSPARSAPRSPPWWPISPRARPGTPMPRPRSPAPPTRRSG